MEVIKNMNCHPVTDEYFKAHNFKIIKCKDFIKYLWVKNIYIDTVDDEELYHCEMICIYKRFHAPDEYESFEGGFHYDLYIDASDPGLYKHTINLDRRYALNEELTIESLEATCRAFDGVLNYFE